MVAMAMTVLLSQSIDLARLSDMRSTILDLFLNLGFTPAVGI